MAGSASDDSTSLRDSTRFRYDLPGMAVASRLVPTWRTMDEAARESGISRRTLTQWVSDGKLRAFRRAGDRKRYVDLDDIRKLQQLRPVDQ